VPVLTEKMEGELKHIQRTLQDYNSENVEEWLRFYNEVMSVRLQLRRMQSLQLCHDKFTELESCEKIILASTSTSTSKTTKEDSNDAAEIENICMELERCAFTALNLSEELKSAPVSVVGAMQAQAAAAAQSKLQFPLSSADAMALPQDIFEEPLPPDNERAQFFMRLAPRIRRLESDVTRALTDQLEHVLMSMNERNHDHDANDHNGNKDLVLSAVGHCLRGLAINGRGKDAESTFARIAIMPLIRSKVSVGRLDEGGSRGQCAGLFSLLDDIACTIDNTFGSVIRMSTNMFYLSETLKPEVDLVTGGVWVPLATALMGDVSIKMAIFSPGIANIIQANYMAIDTFLSELAGRLLSSSSTTSNWEEEDEFASFDVASFITKSAQLRIMQHPTTLELNKKWNLPIYYQLRFGEACKRFDSAIAKVEQEGWHSPVFTGTQTVEQDIRKLGFELPLFIELYDILLSFWRHDVILRPMAHRFLRGIIQLVGRSASFVQSGLEQKNKEMNGTKKENGHGGPSHHYLTWHERTDDVAAVAWDMTILESSLTSDYTELVTGIIAPTDNENNSNSEEERNELGTIVSEVLSETTQDLSPLIISAWSEITEILTKQCSAPLAAVKGVAATYRMTNRPPPKQSSPFVSTVLRPLKDFDTEFSNRTPPQIGDNWKIEIVKIVSESYSDAVEKLIVTVKQTEEALRKRKARKSNAGGMTDGEKVMLQLHLDTQEFKMRAGEVGIDTGAIEGILKLETLTKVASETAST